VDIWGVARADKNGGFAFKVDRYEIPFPDLQFQMIKGKQKTTTTTMGAAAMLFTTEKNITYIQLDISGATFNLEGSKGTPPSSDSIFLEALIIPNETFSGYPVIRVFNSFSAVDSTTGKPMKYAITAGDPAVMEIDKEFPVSATIEKIDLIYFTPNYRYGPPEPNSEPPYAQPFWRFYGHYDNGDAFEILVQALKNEYLLPEIQGWGN
jgi:hypothetical protein